MINEILTRIDWTSFLAGLFFVPVLASVAFVVMLLVSRDHSLGTECRVCDWKFAGLKHNYDVRRRNLDLPLKRPWFVYSIVSTRFHDLVIERGPKHRQFVREYNARFEKKD